MGENLEQILEIIKDSKIVIASSHQKTDDDALFSVIFFKKYIETMHPDKQCIALVDTEEQVSDDITNILGKYKQLGMQTIATVLPAAPDLFLALDCQIGRSDLLVPQVKKDEDVIKLDILHLKKICLDHHKLMEGIEYNFSIIDGSKYSSTTSLILDLFEDNPDVVKKILMEGGQIFASIGYEGIYQDTGGMKKEIMTEADHKAARFLSGFMDHAKMHRLHNKKKNPLTRKMLGEALSKESFDKIENIATYVFLSRQINAADDSKIAEVANGILGCEESQGLGVVVAGIVHDREEDKYSLRLKIRSDNPKILPANEIAKILSAKAGGDKFKAAAVVDLDIFKYSTSSPAFQELIKEEVRDRLLGSELNEATEKKPSKQSLTKPTPLEKLVVSERESEYIVELHRESLSNMGFRSQKKFVSYFVERGLTEDDVNALIGVNNFYYTLMGKGEFKKTQASFIYGLVSEGFEPYLIGIISVKHDEKQSELGSAEDFAKKLFGSNIAETACLNGQENFDSIAFRVPVPYMEYKTNFAKLFECMRYEVSEREKILGEKVDSEEKLKETEAE